MHSGLSFTFGKKDMDSRPTNFEKIQKNLEDVECVIVDEMSLVSADNLYCLHKRLMSLFSSEDLFGGRCVLLVGDILQLPPVKDRAIYKEPKLLSSKAMYETKELNLWNCCQSIHLETNFRQGKSPFTEMLNRCRIGEPTKDDIDTLIHRPHTLLSEEAYYDAMHLFFTNSGVDAHNAAMLNRFQHENLVEIQANLYPPKGYRPRTDAYGHVDGTQLPMTLRLKKGARVLVVSNVNIKDSLVNGSLGTVVEFITKENRGNDILQTLL